MRHDRCPHCNEHGFLVGDLPREVVAVVACHHCGELSVLFRGQIIPLNKRILESGTFEERKSHLAEVITQFLESGDFSFSALEEFSQRPRRRSRKRPPHRLEDDESHNKEPISDQEVDRFIQVDLKCLDNPAYFKRIFG